MFSLKEIPGYFLVFKDGAIYLKISSKNNKLEQIKKYFNIN